MCVDTILNQRQNWETDDPDQQVRCVYVAIGQKGTTIASVRQTLEEGGAMDYTTIVGFTGVRLAGFMACAVPVRRWPALDVRRQARADRVRRPDQAGRGLPRHLAAAAPPPGRGLPGRCVLPAFRLLERCAKLSDELGGGSLTGLPIIETKANDISAYIPTNVISITDGQCFLETDLFNQGVRPAINVGVSVSRVGGAAQIKAMKKVADLVWICRSTASWSRSRRSRRTSTKRPRQLDRGARLVELLKQPQNSPMPVEEQVVAFTWHQGPPRFRAR